MELFLSQNLAESPHLMIRGAKYLYILNFSGRPLIQDVQKEMKTFWPFAQYNFVHQIINMSIAPKGMGHLPFSPLSASSPTSSQ